MYKASGMWSTLPDGGQRPVSDIQDSIIMCVNNPVLGFTMLLHLFVHVSMDLSHIVILKHISALARTLCDAVKLVLMWFLGKAFWFFGVLPALAEAWHPGLIGSWLMLPSILIVIYALLMFKNAFYFPLAVSWNGFEEQKVKDKDSIKVNLDDDFYTALFRSKKLRQGKASGKKDPLKFLSLVVPGSSSPTKSRTGAANSC